MEGTENLFKPILENPLHYLSAEDWNRRQLGSLHQPLLGRRLKLAPEYSVTFYAGNTIFSNCYQQESLSTNPAHWMMKLGLLYELTQCYSRNWASKVFADIIHLPFKHMYMHQCSNPFENRWSWGKTVFSAVTQSMLELELVNKETTFVSTGYVANKQRTEKSLHCFENAYLSGRNGIWLQLSYNHIKFRADIAKLTGEPAEALQNPETVEGALPLGSSQDYCPVDSHSKLTSARIKIFQRTSTKFLRKFINLKEMVALVQVQIFIITPIFRIIILCIGLFQEYSSIPVQVITVNQTSTMLEQIVMFNSFDILISAHGSHLTNAIFTMNPSRKAAMEVVPFAFDRVFYGNYNYLGFAYYTMSTGHTTPYPSIDPLDKPQECSFSTEESFSNNQCSLKTHSYKGRPSQTYYDCPSRLHTRHCDTLVNLQRFRDHLEHLLGQSLCPSKWPKKV